MFHVEIKSPKHEPRNGCIRERLSFLTVETSFLLRVQFPFFRTTIDTVCFYGIKYGIYGVLRQWLSMVRKGESSVARQLKKLTIEIPADLLERATTASGKGVTPTVRRGLELIAAGGAYGRLRRLRGKVKFRVNLSELRED